jgi:starch-binding outer membrane protein, SusD/RagB family
MKNIFKRSSKLMMAMTFALVATTSCDNMLNEPLENEVILEGIDYTKSEDMALLLAGSYSTLNDLQWETFPTISVRGDDVNAGGDQLPLTETDRFVYDRSFWMYNSTWLNLYTDILYYHANMEQLERYKEFAPNPAVADQYIAEIKVMRAFSLLQLSKLWGGLLVPTSSRAEELYTTEVSSQEEVMQHISDEMDAAIPMLPNLRPNQRTDVPGGVTRYTALAIKAMANLEIKNYQAVADATGAIISSNLFTLFPDFYELFKIPGKLASENLLELQYSDLGQSSGQNFSYLFDFFGPNDYAPAVAGAGGGWGFWEPTTKYIKFMLDRGETVRLETTVLFTNEGIQMIKSDPNYANLPGWISNTTRDGDAIGKLNSDANPRVKFSSGKFYLPSNQLTPGRTGYGTNKNFICIRYAEILLIHAEALKNGATSSAMTADAAVNLVRSRANLAPLTGVTLDQVLDEKFAEFATEWGIRFHDLVRNNRTEQLDHEGKDYNDAEDRFLPYPLPQLDLLPQLRDAHNN